MQQSIRRSLNGRSEKGIDIRVEVMPAHLPKVGRQYTFAECLLQQITDKRTLIASVNVIISGKAETENNAEVLAEWIALQLGNIQPSNGNNKRFLKTDLECRLTEYNCFANNNLSRQIIPKYGPILSKDTEKLSLRNFIDGRRRKLGVTAQFDYYVQARQVGYLQVHALQLENARLIFGGQRLDDPIRVYEFAAYAATKLWNLG
jgi:hypothetical protein